MIMTKVAKAAAFGKPQDKHLDRWLPRPAALGPSFPPCSRLISRRKILCVCFLSSAVSLCLLLLLLLSPLASPVSRLQSPISRLFSSSSLFPLPSQAPPLPPSRTSRLLNHSFTGAPASRRTQSVSYKPAYMPALASLDWISRLSFIVSRLTGSLTWLDARPPAGSRPELVQCSKPLEKLVILPVGLP